MHFQAIYFGMNIYQKILKIEDTGIWIMDIINYELEKK
jgi:hypothetical protein